MEVTKENTSRSKPIKVNNKDKNTTRVTPVSLPILEFEDKLHSK